ncbi:hypothetical protein VNO78_12043 [Psophocarpus tetragonolobus]|uniref:Uncharacterized protein n=1 Tax=Psophocarpus tetragonolobus TaxID=3891 RepID=A0AAN9SQ86_PSOTE
MTSVCSGRCKIQRKRTEIVKFKNYKKVPGIKGQDHNHTKNSLVLVPHSLLRVKETSFFCALSWWPCGCSEALYLSDTSTATAMIGFRERERTRERRLSWTRVAIFILWVILVFSLISLFFSMDNETKTTTTTTTTRSLPPKQRGFSQALFHTPSRSRRSTTHQHHQQKTKLLVVSTNGGHDDNHDPHHTTLYGDEKRIIHTGPNPLHN